MCSGYFAFTIFRLTEVYNCHRSKRELLWWVPQCRLDKSAAAQDTGVSEESSEDQTFSEADPDAAGSNPPGQFDLNDSLFDYMADGKVAGDTDMAVSETDRAPDQMDNNGSANQPSGSHPQPEEQDDAMSEAESEMSYQGETTSDSDGSEESDDDPNDPLWKPETKASGDKKETKEVKLKCCF